MSLSRNCPNCKGRIGYWDTFLPGRPDTGYCHGCGTALQFRLGVFGHLLRFVTPFALAAGVYWLTRPWPMPWAIIGFLLLFTVSAIPVAMFFRWYLMKFATLVPGGGRSEPRDTDKNH